MEVCSFYMCFVLSLVLICITAVLDHKSDLSLRTKRLLAVVECALLFPLLVLLIVRCLCGLGAIPPRRAPATILSERTFQVTRNVGRIRESANVRMYDVSTSDGQCVSSGFKVAAILDEEGTPVGG